MAQSIETIYSYPFDDQGDWTIVSIGQGIFTSSTNENCPNGPTCWELEGGAQASRVISVFGYHTIALRIDVTEVSLNTGDWCYIRYKSGAVNWINVNLATKDSNTVKNNDIYIPDTNKYNNRASFEVMIGNNGTGSSDSCYFDGLKVFGTLYTSNPTTDPTTSPTPSPTQQPTSSPTPSPTPSPSASPTANPTPSPTSSPTPSPTRNPTPSPTKNPAPAPTMFPSRSPTYYPTPTPTNNPTPAPTTVPTHAPTDNPTASTFIPTYFPTFVPTTDPTFDPTIDPTFDPTYQPTHSPTPSPILEIPVLPTHSPTLTIIMDTTEYSDMVDAEVSKGGRQFTDTETNGVHIYAIIILCAVLCVCCVGIVMFKYKLKQKDREYNVWKQQHRIDNVNGLQKVKSITESDILSIEMGDVVTPNAKDIVSNNQKQSIINTGTKGHIIQDDTDSDIENDDVEGGNGTYGNDINETQGDIGRDEFIIMGDDENEGTDTGESNQINDELITQGDTNGNIIANSTESSNYKSDEMLVDETETTQ